MARRTTTNSTMSRSLAQPMAKPWSSQSHTPALYSCPLVRTEGRAGAT
jgi:hypothetical protein